MQRARIGMDVVSLDQDTAAALGGINGGAIYRVQPGSPADRAGLKAGDVIFRFDGNLVRDARDLVNKFGLTRVGQRVVLAVIREGKRHDIVLDLNEPRGTVARQ